MNNKNENSLPWISRNEMDELIFNPFQLLIVTLIRETYFSLMIPALQILI